MGAVDSHRTANPIVKCACEGSRLEAPFENHPETTIHPGQWKNCLPWTWSLVPKKVGHRCFKNVTYKALRLLNYSSSEMLLLHFPLPWTLHLLTHKKKVVVLKSHKKQNRAQSKWPLKNGWLACHCLLFTCIICSFQKHLLLRGHEEKGEYQWKYGGGWVLKIHAQVCCLKTDNTFTFFLRTETIFGWCQEILKNSESISWKIIRTYPSISKGVGGLNIPLCYKLWNMTASET